MRKSGRAPVAAWLLVTNAAGATAAGSLFPEAALAHQQQLSPVSTIAVRLAAAEEPLEDALRTRELLNAAWP